MDKDCRYNIEGVVGNSTYSNEVSYEVLQLMLNADLVNIRGNLIEVREIEVTDNGVTKFHGNSRNDM